MYIRGGRPPKRTKFNFNNSRASQHEELANSQVAGPSTSFAEPLISTTRPLNLIAGPSISTIPIQILEMADQPTTSMRPIRAAKIRSRERISDLMMELNETPAEYMRRRRVDEPSDEREQRLTDQCQRQNDMRATEMTDEREQRLIEQRQRQNDMRATETTDEREQRLTYQRQRQNDMRATETTDEREQRLIDQRQRQNDMRANETTDEREQRLTEQRQRQNDMRATETTDEREQRLTEQRQRQNYIRATETTDEREQRLTEQRHHQNDMRAAETAEEHARRLEEQRRRNARRFRATAQARPPTYKLASTSDVSYSSLGPFEVACIHCGAIHFPEERVQNSTGRNSFGDCCLHGRIELEPAQFPNELARLFTRQHPLANDFNSRIRNINACFALSSFNMADDRTFNNRGIYSFRVGGQIYHKMNFAAQPTQDSHGQFERPRYGQMYFMDPDDAIEARFNEPMNQGTSREVMQTVERIIRSTNRFAQAYMMMHEVVEESNQRAAAEGLQPPQVHMAFAARAGDDPRRFNAPTTNEVAAVITLNADQSIPENEMVIHERGKNIATLKNTDSRIEPFTYPLFYPRGEFGFEPHQKDTEGNTINAGIRLKNAYVSRPYITRMEFAQYRLAFRREQAKPLPVNADLLSMDMRQIDFNGLHFGGRLLQQWTVDNYIRIERDRINWIKNHQATIQAGSYSSVTRYLNDLAEQQNATIYEKVILPSTFPGSSRFYAEHFEDAMAIVRRYGSPDWFITATCNPDWPEFKNAARFNFDDGTSIQQSAPDRPELIARIAKLKFDQLINLIDNNQVFGKASAYVYSIEFQKRGLPHIHLLVIMSPEDKIRTAEEIDDFLSAEIPGDDPELRGLILKWNIHNPCGVHNPNAPCMVTKDGRSKCRFGFPKEFQEATSIVEDEKPKYRRRYNPKLDPCNDEFSHEEAIYRKDVNGIRITMDNRHVAPFNAYLTKLFNCHINVEHVGSIKAVKYLYKYIYKGHDCATIKLSEDGRQLIYNEPENYVETRYISPPEACWRLFGNELQAKSHSVKRLDIHLPNQFRMGNPEQQQEDLADIGQKGSMLEAYFRHNISITEQATPNNVLNYRYYWEMPEHYTWDGKNSTWNERRRACKTIGRIHNVNFVSQPELFHMRMLLFHVKDATSFDDLKTVDGVQHATFKQACLARGLTYDDKQWIEGLRESATSKLPHVMRTLFAQILILGSPENPKGLWEMFKDDLAEDFIHEARRTGNSIDEAVKRAYRIIAYKLNTESTEGRNFRYWVQTFGMDDIDNYETYDNHEVISVDGSIAIGERMYRQLNDRQREVVDAILQALDSPTQAAKCFFVDGPGGTGKTFVYTTLYHLIRGRNRQVKCTAFTGIAAILLPGGHTAHKTFGLKVPLTSDSRSSIQPGSPKARELAAAEVFMMDEAPMLPKYGLENIDQLLRTINFNNIPFGGKVMVLGGDFRQCLPIQPRANRSELIDLSIKRSALWHHFNFFTLDKNMRVDPEEEEFADYLLKLGNGELETNELDEIKVPEEIISNGNIIDETFGICLQTGDYEAMKKRAILAALNKDVQKTNDEIIGMLPGDAKSYKSFDSIKDQTEALQFTPEFLNTIDIADLPPHDLTLKKNTIIMLLRNLDVSEGLCNGTRLIVTELCNNIIKGKIITGEYSGRDVHIPRITLDSSKSKLGCTMQRHQFPVRPAFAITIHKSQGQTFEFVAVILFTAVFMHGMLYVAFSRVKRRSALKVLLPTESQGHTKNVVWTEILERRPSAANNTNNSQHYPEDLEDFDI